MLKEQAYNYIEIGEHERALECFYRVNVAMYDYDDVWRRDKTRFLKKLKESGASEELLKDTTKQSLLSNF